MLWPFLAHWNLLSVKEMDGGTLKGCLMVDMDPRMGVQINTFIWHGKVKRLELKKNTTRLLFEQRSILGASGDQWSNAFLI